MPELCTLEDISDRLGMGVLVQGVGVFCRPYAGVA